MVSRKNRFGLVQTHMYYFLDSGPKFTGLTCFAERGRNRSRSHVFPILDLVPEIFAIKVGSCVKSRQISRVFGPNIFRGQPPNFLDWDYKAHPDIDHVLKFHGDRLSELGDLVAN